jgi:hypothetical protein
MRALLRTAVVVGTIAAAFLQAAPAPAGGNRCAPQPFCFGGGLALSNPQPQPGTVVTYWLDLGGDPVDVATVTVKLPPEMVLVRAGSTPFALVGATPTWTLRKIDTDLSAPRRMRFRVRVRPATRRGTELLVAARVVAKAGNAQNILSVWITARVPRS